MSAGRLADRLFWPLLTLAGLAQTAGLVLVIAELLVLDLAYTALFNLAAYAVLATTSLAGHAVAGRTALRAASLPIGRERTGGDPAGGCGCDSTAAAPHRRTDSLSAGPDWDAVRRPEPRRRPLN